MSVSASNKSRIFAHTAAVRLGEALLIGFAVIILLAGLDKAQREQLETFQEVTAVGDRAFFPMPEQHPQPPVAAVTFRGDGLVPVSYEPVEIRDTRMIRLGKDESGQYSVYSRRAPADEKERGKEKEKLDPEEAKYLYLKVARDEYLRTLPVEQGK